MELKPKITTLDGGKDRNKKLNNNSNFTAEIVDKKQNNQSPIINGKLHVSLSAERLREQTLNNITNMPGNQTDSSTRPIDISNNTTREYPIPFSPISVMSDDSHITLQPIIPSAEEPDEHPDLYTEATIPSTSNSTTPFIPKTKDLNIYITDTSQLDHFSIQIAQQQDGDGYNNQNEISTNNGISNGGPTKGERLIELLSNHGYSLSEERKKTLIQQADELLIQPDERVFQARVDQILDKYEQHPIFQVFHNKAKLKRPFTDKLELHAQRLDNTEAKAERKSIAMVYNFRHRSENNTLKERLREQKIHDKWTKWYQKETPIKTTELTKTLKDLQLTHDDGEFQLLKLNAVAQMRNHLRYEAGLMASYEIARKEEKYAGKITGEKALTPLFRLWADSYSGKKVNSLTPETIDKTIPETLKHKKAIKDKKDKHKAIKDLIAPDTRSLLSIGSDQPSVLSEPNSHIDTLTQAKATQLIEIFEEKICGTLSEDRKKSLKREIIENLSDSENSSYRSKANKLVALYDEKSISPIFNNKKRLKKFFTDKHDLHLERKSHIEVKNIKRKLYGIKFTISKYEITHGSELIRRDEKIREKEIDEKWEDLYKQLHQEKVKELEKKILDLKGSNTNLDHNLQTEIAKEYIDYQMQLTVTKRLNTEVEKQVQRYINRTKTKEILKAITKEIANIGVFTQWASITGAALAVIPLVENK